MTPAIVREALATSIAALVPTVRPTDGFQRYTGSLKFEEHLERDPAHAFRRWTLHYELPPAMPMVSNGHSGRWRYPFVLTVAYPAVHYKDLDVPRLDLEDAMDADHILIVPVLRDHVGAAFIAEDATLETEASDESPYVLRRYRCVFELWRNV